MASEKKDLDVITANSSKMSRSSQSEHVSEPRANLHYAVLMETNGEENESWYNFIVWEGNEDALRYLHKQLNSIEWYIIQDTDFSTFDLDLDHLVSDITAYEMCQLDINPFMYHRKFNGSLKKINFKLSDRDDNDDKIEKVNNLLGYGEIDRYIDGEEIFHSDNELSDSYCSDSTSEEED